MTNTFSNGYYIGKLISEIYPTFIKRSGQKFPLNPEIKTLVDSSQKRSKEKNWFTIAR
jgi:hypothetical protein